MNNSFSPRHNFNSPGMTFQQDNRFQSPHNRRFHSPCSPNQMVLVRSPNYSSPVEKYSQNAPCSPKQMMFVRSPNYSNPVERYSPRNTSPFHHQFYQNSPKLYNQSLNNREQRSKLSDLSFSPESSSSSSYFGDVSRDSSYNLPYRNRRLQNKRCFQSPNSSDSNPGHSPDIRQYINPSMLEDPWKDLMAAIEKKSSTDK